MTYTVIERATGKIVEIWDSKNVKGSASPDGIQKMRNQDDHENCYFMINFKGLNYDFEIYEVDKYDLIIS